MKASPLQRVEKMKESLRSDQRDQADQILMHLQVVYPTMCNFLFKKLKDLQPHERGLEDSLKTYGLRLFLDSNNRELCLKAIEEAKPFMKQVMEVSNFFAVQDTIRKTERGQIVYEETLSCLKAGCYPARSGKKKIKENLDVALKGTAIFKADTHSKGGELGLLQLPLNCARRSQLP